MVDEYSLELIDDIKIEDLQISIDKNDPQLGF